MSVEEQRIRPHAQGVQTQQHLLQQLLCVQRTRFVLGQFLLHEFVQIGEDGIVLRRKLAKVCLLRNAPTGIQFGQHDLYGVQLRVGEVFVGSEEVLQKGDVPRQQGGLAKGIRGCLVGVLIPAPHFQHIDALFSGH